jgi:putative heme iron utilization protein
VARNERIERARKLMHRERHGVLCTLSQSLNGWPFASLTPYAFAASGDPIILTSQLAEHTRNIYSDPRVSLFIIDAEARANPQAGARLTLMGLADQVPEAESGEARSRYLARFPESEGLFQMADFSLFKLNLERGRYIGGFGDIFWLSPADLLQPFAEEDPLAPEAAAICQHLNEDHAHSLTLLCAAHAGLIVTTARAVGIDGRGLDLAVGAEAQRVRIDFPHPVTTPDEARQMLIELVRQARNPEKSP